jgi:hypothetical protein
MGGACSCCGPSHRQSFGDPAIDRCQCHVRFGSTWSDQTPRSRADYAKTINDETELLLAEPRLCVGYGFESGIITPRAVVMLRERYENCWDVVLRRMFRKPAEEPRSVSFDRFFGPIVARRYLPKQNELPRPRVGKIAPGDDVDSSIFLSAARPERRHLTRRPEA